MIPPSLAAMWIASRWLKTRGTSTEVRAELAALRDEVAELRQAQVDMQERVDFTERMLSQVRESQRELPKGSA
jgi:uncharacterized protein YlxW (UPF0749 family)